MAVFKQNGDTIKHTPGGNIIAGAVIVIGEKVCIAKHDILAGVEGELDTNGVFNFAKDNTTAFAQCVKVYWDVADQEATEDADSGTNKLIGYVHKAEIDTVENVDCYLVNNVA